MIDSIFIGKGPWRRASSVKQPFLITHYYHSGFSVAGEHTLLVFDYWRGERGELTPEIQLTPEKLRAYENVFVFISHEHIDHLDPIVFSWNAAGNVSWIVSSDMPVGTRGKRMAPGDTVKLSEEVTVTAFDSTDLGVSFHHFDAAERGFSFRYDAPLDMRMNNKQKLSAADIVNTYSEEDLARVLYLYGEFRDSRAIASQIIRKRSAQAIETTQQLLDSVRLRDKQDAARLFQALRIEVNDELGALRELLEASTQLLAPGGRLVILTYHSLEDRIVKNFMRSGNTEGTIEKDFYGNALTPFRVIEKGRMASAEEVERNPRARSAKLRIAEKV